MKSVVGKVTAVVVGGLFLVGTATPAFAGDPGVSTGRAYGSYGSPHKGGSMLGEWARAGDVSYKKFVRSFYHGHRAGSGGAEVTSMH
jgi:hypothetical protein